MFGRNLILISEGLKQGDLSNREETKIYIRNKENTNTRGKKETRKNVNLSN